MVTNKYNTNTIVFMLIIPKEFYIPASTEVIFVQDFFVKELVGGAELTSDAIIKACPKKLFELHAHSITETLITKHKDKIWVFGNQTATPPYLLQKFIDLKIRYYFFEYDFKPCVMRSTKKHELTSKVCGCEKTSHGLFMANWMTHARVLFWCSTGQKNKFFGLFPEFENRTPSFVQSSTFYPETIHNIRKVRERKERGEIEVVDRWLILQSDSWIKGTEDAVKYCAANNLNAFLIGGVSNETFLEELAKSKGMIFFPRDIDVGSRTWVEAKLLNVEVVCNENVLTQYEPYAEWSTAKVEEYFLDGPARFWRVVEANP